MQRCFTYMIMQRCYIPLYMRIHINFLQPAQGAGCNYELNIQTEYVVAGNKLVVPNLIVGRRSMHCQL